jgi:hypothetical protein
MIGEYDWPAMPLRPREWSDPAESMAQSVPACNCRQLQPNILSNRTIDLILSILRCNLRLPKRRRLPWQKG